MITRPIQKSTDTPQVLTMPKITTVCPICGTAVQRNASDKRRTCGAADCVRAWRAQICPTLLSAPRAAYWTPERRAEKSSQGQTDSLQKGTAAAQASPKAGPYETNQNALTWTLLSPDNQIYTVRNLALWCRDNAAILPSTPKNACAGIRFLKLSQMDKTKRPVSSWHGWRLLSWSKDP
jgi:hypothetical protein